MIRIILACWIVVMSYAPSEAANDIPMEAYSDTVIKKINIDLSDRKTVVGFVQYLISDRDFDVKHTCLEKNIDSEFLYKEAFTYEETPLKEATVDDPLTRRLLGQYVFANNKGKVKVDKSKILKCSGVIFNDWTDGGQSLSSFIELKNDVFTKIKNSTPYGIASSDINGNVFILISYNSDYIDFSDIDVEKSIYRDLYVKTYSKIFDDVRRKYETRNDKHIMENEISDKVIKAMQGMENIGIIFLLVQDKSDGC